MVNGLNNFRGRVFLFGANNEKWHFLDFLGALFGICFVCCDYLAKVRYM